MKKLNSVSFEFFPPKTEESQGHLLAEALNLSGIEPHFFSVTYGAGGSTRDKTINTVRLLQQTTSIPVAPHISCIGSKREMLIEILSAYKSLGVKRIVALRGDRPADDFQQGDLSYAYELVQLIRDVTNDAFFIEVAAYPECHPEAKSTKEDILNLRKKVDAGANSAITQYFYNPDAYAYFLDECSKAGILIPIVPGIMPIMSLNKLIRFSNLCGAEIPKWLLKRLENYGDDTASLQAFSLEVVFKLCERLVEYGANSLHFYTLNQAEPSMTLVKQMMAKKYKILGSSLDRHPERSEGSL
ncbi:MAG: methylenetetrahydrofolate reductase [NAD(P)H] [Gammaproteobacteria bacterium RIFCSPHIGHO2_12_FULL_38_14]|nr:MAG: methylenetetrahydrofolate reductase [NAD(P)H] [Gammaproteobacteria bacterium RIFCSPHIGHO2_12_FULL_38_14]